MLFQTAEQLKAVLGTLQKNITVSTLLPYVEQAQLTHLRPVLGDALLAELDAQLVDESQDPDFLEMLASVRRPLAYYALLEALPFLNVQIGDLGIKETQTQNATAVRQWSYQGLELAAAKNAEVFLDAAVQLLERKADKWPSWSTSEACTLLRGQLIQNATTLSRYLNIQGSRRAFLAFLPFLERAEELYIRPVVSEELLQALKGRLVDGSPSRPQDVALLLRIRPALAQLALNEALPELSLSLSGTGISVLTDSYVVKQRLASSQEELDKLAAKARMLADRYITELRQFLDRNVEAYPEYQDSDAYNFPGESPTYDLPDNTGSAGFWV